MFSHAPIDLDSMDEEDIDKSILRISIAAEMDAASLYEQMAAKTKDRNLKKVLLDIAREEKTHIGEFSEMLSRIDKEQKEENKKGKEEVKELTED